MAPGHGTGESARPHFLKAITAIAGGTAVSQLLPVAVSPILTRVYSPQDFGVFVVVASTLAILTSIGSLRYETALLIPKEERRAEVLLFVALASVVLTSCVTALVLGIASFGHLPLGPLSVAHRYLFWIPIGLLAVGFYTCIENWGLRHRHFNTIARARAWQGVTGCLVQLGLAVLVRGPSGLISGNIAGQSVGGTRLAAKTHAFSRTRRPTMREFAREAFRYRDFPMLGSASVLLNVAALQVPSLFIAQFFGIAVAGWYALGLRCVSLPMLLVGRAVAQVYTAEAAKLAVTDISEMRRLFKQTALRLLAIGVVVLVPIAVVMHFAVGPIFGSSWKPAGTYILIISPNVLAQFVTSPLSQTLVIFQRLRLQLAVDTVRLIGVVGALVVCHYLNYSVVMALGALSAIMVVSYGLHFSCCILTLKYEATTC